MQPTTGRLQQQQKARNRLMRDNQYENVNRLIKKVLYIYKSEYTTFYNSTVKKYEFLIFGVLQNEINLFV